MRDSFPSNATSVVQLSKDAFRDKPVDRLLKDVAMEHTANITGHFDWFDGSVAANRQLLQATPAPAAVAAAVATTNSTQLHTHIDISLEPARPLVVGATHNIT